MTNKVRVYTLANELGLSSKEMKDLLANEGVEVKSHTSTIEEDIAELVRTTVLAKREDKGPELELPPEPPSIEEEEEDLEDEDDEAIVSGNEISLKPPIVVRDLANAMSLKPNVIISELMMMNVFATINQAIPPETAELLCKNHGFSLVQRKKREKKKGKGSRRGVREELQKKSKESKRERREKLRPPVVACLGHVDHGKTSLLDAIRHTESLSSESGGITQHIGASVVKWEDNAITFLDTPGHEAFTTMRLRGANATDVVILVVAANDGVMPQTIEAINHAKAAGVTIVVAMNKIDLPQADEQRVLLGLQQNGITPEDWGGDVGIVPISALTGEGIDDLLERIMLEAEMLELTADPKAPCKGIVIEAQKESGMGTVANVMVQDGTLHAGDVMMVGNAYGKVRALINHLGKRVKSAGPSTPVQVVGLSEVPDAGETFSLIDSERTAKMLIEEKQTEKRQQEAAEAQETTLESLFSQMADREVTELRLLVKADVQGSAEAIVDNLKKLKSEKVRLEITNATVGEITENDILLAATSGTVLLGFHVRISPALRRLAAKNNVDVRLYSIIYELLDDVHNLMLGKVEPETKERLIGKVEIREVFNVSKVGKICGSYITSGNVRVGSSARVVREGEIIYNGLVQNLKRFKDDVREVREGFECGIRLDNFEDFEVGDVLEIFDLERLAPEL